MRFITAEQLFDRFAGKQTLVLKDLIRFLEAEFDVSLKVVEKSDNNDEMDVKALANDEEIQRHIRASRDDRAEGRVYRGMDALDRFNKKAGERRRGTNV